MKNVLIVSGGGCSANGIGENYGYVIACDRGYENCKKLNIKPDLVVGDFDSCGVQIDCDTEVVRLNPVKDDTDTMSAVRRALALDAEEITICCAFGGRLDHTLANIQSAAFILDSGARAVVCGEGCVCHVIKDGSVTVSRRDGCYLSVFALSDKCCGVNIKGAKYVLENAVLTKAYPVGVSNECEADTVTVSVVSGMLAVMVCDNVGFA